MKMDAKVKGDPKAGENVPKGKRNHTPAKCPSGTRALDLEVRLSFARRGTLKKGSWGQTGLKLSRGTGLMALL